MILDDDFDEVSGGLRPHSVSLPWPLQSDGPLWITVHWHVLEGRWECIGLAIDFAPGARVRPLRTSDLRGIRLGEVLTEAAYRLRAELREELRLAEKGVRSEPTPQQDANIRQLLTMMAEFHGESADTESIDRQLVSIHTSASAAVQRELQELISLSEPKKPGRPALSPEHLQEVARVYRAAFASRKAPTKAVAEHFNVSRTAAAKWVAKCRGDAGLLGDTSRGRPGGILPLGDKEAE